MFGERGYAGVSMQQLADGVGVNARAIYHYFPSKRTLFEATTSAAFAEYGSAVLTHVLVHDCLRDRLHGFIELYRVLFRTDRPLLSFLSVVMVDGITMLPSGPSSGIDLAMQSAPIVAMNALLVDEAVARRELADSITSSAAVLLLQIVGMGLGLASLGDEDEFIPMLDALDLLIDGTLLT
jgi:AcrR family transcriptional regulator